MTNFNAKRNFQGSRENLHLIERWTRIDANTLEYVVTIEDPTTWTKPWTVKVELQRQNDQENRIYYEPRCHEGNFAHADDAAGRAMDDEQVCEGPRTRPGDEVLYRLPPRRLNEPASGNRSLRRDGRAGVRTRETASGAGRNAIARGDAMAEMWSHVRRLLQPSSPAAIGATAFDVG